MPDPSGPVVQRHDNHAGCSMTCEDSECLGSAPLCTGSLRPRPGSRRTGQSRDRPRPRATAHTACPRTPTRTVIFQERGEPRRGIRGREVDHPGLPGFAEGMLASDASAEVRVPRLNGFPLASQPAERPASSALIALRWAKMGTQVAEPGRARARDAWSSRLVRCSSASVSLLTSWLRLGSGTGDSCMVSSSARSASVVLTGARSRRDLACSGLFRWGPLSGGHRVGKRRLRVGAVVH